MRNEVEQLIINTFLKLRSKHDNSMFAIDELDWLIFDKYKDRFWSLSEEDQWEVRNILESLKKIHKF